MTHRKTVTGLAVLALGLGGAGTAVAAKTRVAPSKVTVRGVGSGTFKINRYAQDGTRYDHDVYTVRSGGTLTFLNTQTDEGPHTLTVLKKSQMPKNDAQINKCGSFQGNGICQRIAGKHQPDENTGAFKTAVINTGKVGLDGPGDSVAITPKGAPGSRQTINVSARKGSTLYFVCLVHPWMQAKILVK